VNRSGLCSSFRRKLWQHHAKGQELSLRLPLQSEIESSRQASLIYHWAVEDPRLQKTREVRHRRVPHYDHPLRDLRR